jgi:hypothetical protein
MESECTITYKGVSAVYRIKAISGKLFSAILTNPGGIEGPKFPSRLIFVIDQPGCLGNADHIGIIRLLAKEITAPNGWFGGKKLIHSKPQNH